MATWLSPHLQGKQDGQQSPSSKDGLAQVAGGQEVWWQTVLNFCNKERHARDARLKRSLSSRPD